MPSPVRITIGFVCFLAATATFISMLFPSNGWSSVTWAELASRVALILLFISGTLWGFGIRRSARVLFVVTCLLLALAALRALQDSPVGQPARSAGGFLHPALIFVPSDLGAAPSVRKRSR